MLLESETLLFIIVNDSIIVLLPILIFSSRKTWFFNSISSPITVFLFKWEKLPITQLLPILTPSSITQKLPIFALLLIHFL